jgi:hypothetical protein
MDAALTRRIMKETERLSADPVPGISASPKEDNLRYFDVKLEGQADTPYHGGTFKLELFLPDGYPMCPPKVRFLTKVSCHLGLLCFLLAPCSYPPTPPYRAGSSSSSSSTRTPPHTPAAHPTHTSLAPLPRSTTPT